MLGLEGPFEGLEFLEGVHFAAGIGCRVWEARKERLEGCEHATCGLLELETYQVNNGMVVFREQL